MNIFFLDRDPVLAAQMQCDKHVVKMVLETAQLLSGTWQLLDSKNAPPGIYKATHSNHPCALWARQSRGNYEWLCNHGVALATEYTYRYDREHRSELVINACMFAQKDLLCLPAGEFTDPPQCMPEQYRCDDTVEAYRQYYLNDKSRFAKWEKGREAPEWWKICPTTA